MQDNLSFIIIVLIKFITIFFLVIGILLLVAGAGTFIDVLEGVPLTEEKLTHGLLFPGGGIMLLVARTLKNQKASEKNTRSN